MYLCITKQTKMSKYYKDNKLYTPTPQELIEWGETETPPKYMKSIDPETKGLVVEFVEDRLIGEFKGIVIERGETDYSVGALHTRWVESCFEPCELNTDTLTNDNPNKVEVDDKDVNLRLECLKLAIELNKRNGGLDMAYCLEEAIESYNWIKTNQ